MGKIHHGVGGGEEGRVQRVVAAWGGSWVDGVLCGLGCGMCPCVCVLYVVLEPLGVGILGGRFHGGVLIAKVQNKLSCLCLYIPKKREKNGSKSSQATCQISAVEVNHHCRACPRGGGEGKGEGES